MRELLLVAGLTLVPWVELRGAIPVGLALGQRPLEVLAVAVAANAALVLPAWWALDLAYGRWLSRWAPVRRQVERVRRSGEGYVRRYGLVGLTLFVAVPLPGTGAYAGAALAWLLGLPRAGALAAIACGVILAGAAVTLVATGAVSLIRILP
ncbi:MAG: small multi-drug export protein [Armatimonadota bacterium]|nr:small multi-drug export protein [Armatimonadota bacterium]MDR7401602.1 small multi-drug export protein [Armatimonadota bacterium]MDR7405074.1 small multi-drug export protein [Armatimonadota bacterium]MDR7436867.1 small multi-drug export protein [Armatimonadota bacterium]MDR7471592.1 small multi-drug export protein [Armatimonadota bacterium]